MSDIVLLNMKKILLRYGDCTGTFWFETGDLGLGYCNRSKQHIFFGKPHMIKLGSRDIYSEKGRLNFAFFKIRKTFHFASMKF